MLNKPLFPRIISTQKPLILGEKIVRGGVSYGFRGKNHRMAILELFTLELFRIQMYRRLNFIVPYKFRSRKIQRPRFETLHGQGLFIVDETRLRYPVP